MPRNIDPATLAGLSAKVVYPVLLVDLTISGATLFVWSGVGNFSWNGNTYTGVGTLGSVTPAAEGVDIEAAGATLTLSGVDPALVTDALSELQLGAACSIRLGVLDQTGALVGPPVVLYAGLVDSPTVHVGIEEATIVIPLESRMAVLSSGQSLKLDRVSQALKYPDDISLHWVEQLQNQALRWGS